MAQLHYHTMDAPLMAGGGLSCYIVHLVFARPLILACTVVDLYCEKVQLNE
jgi:hypothetical protein